MSSYTHLRGMAVMFLAVILYSINDALLKWLAGTYHPTQVIFCRSFFVLIPMLGLLCQKSSWQSLRSNRLGYHFLRALIAALALPCYIYAYKLLPLADAYAVAYVAPLFMAIFSIPILGEKVEKHAWIAILIGFSGILVMMRPGSHVFSLGGLLAFIAGVLYALSLVMSRKLSRTESEFSLTLWFMGMCFMMSCFFIPFYWKSPPLFDWCLFAVLGITGGAAFMAITRAFSLAPASIVGPIDYLILVFGAILGYVIWNDIPDIFTITGAMVLVFSGLYLLYYETRRRKEVVLFPVIEE